MTKIISYSDAILEGFEFLLTEYPEVFVIGQGLWSPWYVGNSMKDLDTKFGKDRIIDSPVSESATTGIAVGASITDMRPIVVHPRMDFMLYAVDSIVNQSAKWSYIFGGQASPKLTIRSIINRGGEQGAQHSQALHSWFAHIPGLRVVMPSTVCDARDLLISSVLSDDPVLYIDDRWLYEQKEKIDDIKLIKLKDQEPEILQSGSDLTIVGNGFSTLLAKNSLTKLNELKISTELIDLRILNPINFRNILNSVKKTHRLLVIDGGWKSCGIGSEVIASIAEQVSINDLKLKVKRLNIANSPAPTSTILEKEYYPDIESVVKSALELFQ